MRDIATDLKNLRLYGMAGAWDELLAQGESAGLQSARWLVEHLLDVEHTDRAMRSISYQRGGPAQLDRNLVFLSEFSAG